MLHAVFAHALPFSVALAVAAALRLIGGVAAGGRLSGLAVGAGFLTGWVWLYGLTIHPGGLLDIAAHLALGGTLAGLVLDVLGAPALWRRLVGTGFLVTGVWAAFDWITALPEDAAARAALVVEIAALAAVWGATLLRLDRHQATERGAEGAALLAALAAGLALTAAAAGAAAVAAPAAALAAATLGFLGLAALVGLPLGAAAVLGGGGALLGLAQALVAAWPHTALPLAVLVLALFSGGTVARMARRPALRPLWTLLLTLLPGVLAAATALALRG